MFPFWSYWIPNWCVVFWHEAVVCSSCFHKCFTYSKLVFRCGSAAECDYWRESHCAGGWDDWSSVWDCAVEFWCWFSLYWASLAGSTYCLSVWGNWWTRGQGRLFGGQGRQWEWVINSHIWPFVYMMLVSWGKHYLLSLVPGLPVQTFELDQHVLYLEQNSGGSGDNSSVVDLEIRVTDLETESAAQAENINTNTQSIEGSLGHFVPVPFGFHLCICLKAQNFTVLVQGSNCHLHCVMILYVMLQALKVMLCYWRTGSQFWRKMEMTIVP